MAANETRQVISGQDTLSSQPQKPLLDRESAVVKSGWLSKKGKRKIWSKRWFVLRETQLTYYKDEREYKVRGLIKTMDIEAVSMMKHKGKEGRFAIFTSSHTYCLQAETISEAQVWVSVIDATSKMATEELISGDPYRDINRPSVINTDLETSPSSSPDAGQHLFSKNSDRASIGGILHDSGSFSSPSLPAIKPFHRPKIFESSGDEWGFSSDSESNYARARSPRNGGGTSSHEKDHDEGPQPMAILNASKREDDVGRSASLSPSKVGYGSRGRNLISSSGLPASRISFISSEIKHPDRIIMEGYLSRLHSHLGQKEWTNRYVVLKPLQVQFYRNESEADKARSTNLSTSRVDKILRPNSEMNGVRVRIIPLGDIAGVVEIDPISKGRRHCMQIITPEKLIKLSASSDEDLTNWLAAFQSALRRIKLRRNSAPDIPSDTTDKP